MGTRSLSWRLTPQAPTSASIATMSFGAITGRTKSPKGSRPRFPTVHRPNVNLCSGFGSNVFLDMDAPSRAFLPNAHPLDYSTQLRPQHITSAPTLRAED